MAKRCIGSSIGPMANVIQQPPTIVNPSPSPDEFNTTGAEDDNQTTKGSKTRKTRGSALPIKEWGSDKKLILELNELDQAIGENVYKLATQLGVMARNSTICPITYNDWRCKDLKDYKERIWNDVKDNCEVPDTFKKTCLMAAGKYWRDWKVRLKKDHYSCYETDEERIGKAPESVDSEQWKIFVKYQGSEIALKRSQINKENANKKKTAHATGRKPHRILRQEMAIAGILPDRIDLYIKAHKKSNGDPVDQAAAEAIDGIEHKLESVSPSERTPEFREKVFTEVLGPDTHGRVRTLGLGPCPTQVFGEKIYQSHELEKIRMDYEYRLEKMRMENELNIEKVRAEAEEKAREMFNNRVEQLELKFGNIESRIGKVADTVQKTKNGKPVVFQQVSDGESSNHFEDPPNVGLQVGDVVRLIGYAQPKKVVAEGVILSKDPQKEVGGMLLGGMFWEVRIDTVIEPHENLMISQHNMKKVGQARDKSVAWAIYDVKMK